MQSFFTNNWSAFVLSLNSIGVPLVMLLSQCGKIIIHYLINVAAVLLLTHYQIFCKLSPASSGFFLLQEIGTVPDRRSGCVNVICM